MKDTWDGVVDTTEEGALGCDGDRIPARVVRSTMCVCVCVCVCVTAHWPVFDCVSFAGGFGPALVVV